MSEKRYTEGEVKAMVAEIEQGLSDEQVAQRKADIEKKYGLSPGALSKFKLSTSEEAEEETIFRPHFEASVEELTKMSPEEYARWRVLGAHQKQPSNVEEGTEAEATARADELALVESMTAEQYALYREGQDLKAQREKEEVARLSERERQDKLNALRHKSPEDMSMEEYERWTKVR